MEDLGQSSASATRSPDKSSTFSSGHASRSQRIVIDPSANRRPPMFDDDDDDDDDEEEDFRGEERYEGHEYDEDEPRYAPMEDEESIIPLPRSHTPGQLAARSNLPGDQHRGSKGTAELPLRQRAISASHSHPPPPRPATAPGQRKPTSSSNSVPDLPLPSLAMAKQNKSQRRHQLQLRRRE
ncbi:hypothetical protein TrVGV298_003084 [Trichoderma virens]|nr:hypothetical protein TrVGV298_003084 [Trichoderma virens]UKZ75377.1 hypothetical protein TrVFT333_003060 [Trichoderma virens FT-333]